MTIMLVAGEDDWNPNRLAIDGLSEEERDPLRGALLDDEEEEKRM